MNYEVQRTGYKVPHDRYTLEVKNRKAVAQALLERLQTAYHWMTFKLDSDTHAGIRILGNSFGTEVVFYFTVFKLEKE